MPFTSFHKKYVNVTIMIVLFITIHERYSGFCTPATTNLDPMTSVNNAMVVLGNGCYHVFIDAGSNRGVHGRFLFEPEKYKKCAFAAKFQQHFGDNRTLQNICVFPFEPNPIHNLSQGKTQAAYELMGWRYKYMPVAVGTVNGTMIFYRNTDVPHTTSEQVSFGVKRRGKPDKGQETRVDVIDFAEWLEQNIFKRVIPEKNTFNRGPPIVMMKMDIEGSEYAVLDHLVKTGTGRKFDYILGEWHHVKSLPFMFRGRNITNASEATSISIELTAALLEHGGPGFLDFDDEQYFQDGMEYPLPPLLV